MDDEQWKNFRENMRYHRLKQGITNVKIAALLKKDKGWVSCTEAGAYARWPKPMVADCKSVRHGSERITREG
ncbi:hypothetical protein [Acidaminococcus timonensis]|uniref:hypothetical protein n=1 Tax=Acidaminococcus timonensis TaxID=1871002 RepID=UPI003076AD60